MTFTSRLLLFYLGTLASVLVGFSVTLYFLASSYLYSQADEQLETALTTLSAGIVTGTDGPASTHDDHIVFPNELFEEAQFSWAVLDSKGRRIDGATDRTSDALVDTNTIASAEEMHPLLLSDQAGRPWLVMYRRFESGRISRVASDGEGAEAAGIDTRHALVVGLSLDSLNSTLRRLAGLLVLLSTGIWLAALVGGRRLLRHALAPLIAMAKAANEIRAENHAKRLPSPATDDEIGELGRAFNSLLDRLQESFERQKRFTSDASHQLRTPLTVILGQAEVAIRRDRSADDYRQVLLGVCREAKYLQNMVEALLFLARTDVDAPAPQLTRIDLERWLRGYVAAKAANKQWTNLQLVIDQPGIFVSAHLALLSQLVDILVDNAVKYGAPESPVLIRLRRQNGTACLSIEDHGAGISSSDILHLFEPFYRSTSARRQGIRGLGLGLSIALRLAKSFNGRIDVLSQLGEGSTFTIVFPLEADCETAPNEPSPPVAELVRASQQGI